MKTILYVIGIGLAALSASCARQDEATKQTIRFDQCGYMLGHPKMAFIERPEAQQFSIIDEKDKVVFEGQIPAEAFWAEANENVAKLDFSQLDVAGNYRIVVDDVTSDPFAITENPYQNLAKDVVRAYYYNRSATAIDEAHGGKWVRAAGHPDTKVMVHASAASDNRPEGTIISSPGGWYDAGDYNKYIVNSGISTYTLLLVASMYNSMASQVELNIPESGNSLPDLIDETIYNLRWMLTMQDPNDGGVYHKLTSLNFEDFIRPDECKKQRYVVTKTTSAALDLAATGAFAYRTLKCYPELQSFTDSCLLVARRAFDWAQNNPIVYFNNPQDVLTGTYGDNNIADEQFWAATELWLATGEDKYQQVALDNMQPASVPSWVDVGMLAYYSMLNDDITLPNVDAKKVVVDFTDYLLQIESKSPISLSLRGYVWGSNSSVANEGMLKLIAYRATHDIKYYESALNDLHYILGRNATGYCFVTGQTSHSPRHIHHRISESDGIDDPVPGFLAGGPNTNVPTDCPTARSQYPAKAYSDEQCSYSTNEIAINWNAPLTFLVWGLIANE